MYSFTDSFIDSFVRSLNLFTIWQLHISQPDNQQCKLHPLQFSFTCVTIIDNNTYTIITSKNRLSRH